MTTASEICLRNSFKGDTGTIFEEDDGPEKPACRNGNCLQVNILVLSQSSAGGKKNSHKDAIGARRSIQAIKPPARFPPQAMAVRY